VRKVFSAVVLAVTMSASASLLAHHNVAAIYDAQNPIPIEGTITSVLWRNPHVFVFVDAKTSDGAVVNWKVELLGGLTLGREGIHKDVLKAGDPVNMTVCVAKDGSHTAAAKYFFVPASLENKRAGLCK